MPGFLLSLAVICTRHICRERTTPRLEPPLHSATQRRVHAAAQKITRPRNPAAFLQPTSVLRGDGILAVFIKTYKTDRIGSCRNLLLRIMCETSVAARAQSHDETSLSPALRRDPWFETSSSQSADGHSGAAMMQPGRIQLSTPHAAVIW